LKAKSGKVLQLQATVDVATLYVGEQIERSLEGSCHITSAFLTGVLPKNRQESSEIKYFNFTKRKVRGVLRWFSTWRLYSFVKLNGFNLVISHRFKSIHMMLLVCRLLNIPMIGVVHGIGDFDRKYRQRYMKILISDSSSFVAVSEDVKNYMINQSCGFTKENTTTITNAVDIDHVAARQLSRVEARNELGVPKQVFVFGLVARLVPVKGHSYLLKAFGSLFEEYPQARIVIIGDGRIKLKLKALVDKLKIKEKATFVGQKSDASRYMKAFDVFFFLSLSEGMPLAMQEAMCAGIPVVGSKIPALASLVEGAEGHCFEPKDSVSLALVMRLYLDKPRSELDALGESAYQYVRDRHSIHCFQKGYQQLVLTRMHESK